jgi:2-keto-4-pentenoate hydratase/2-oxohepta-3-ene-1,7-dioic acid hydratase in catechol pathway
MKLIRFGKRDTEKPGVLLEDGTRLDVSAFGSDFDESFFGNEGPSKLEEWLKKNQANCPKVADEIRWGSPLCRPSKLVCVGLNYAKHAEESGMEAPKEPVLFFKATSAIVGPYDPIVIPKGSQKQIGR